MIIPNRFHLHKFVKNGFDGDHPEYSMIFVEKFGQNFTQDQVEHSGKYFITNYGCNGVAYAVAYGSFVAVPIYLEDEDVPGPIYYKNIRRVFKWGFFGHTTRMRLYKNHVGFKDQSSFLRTDEVIPMDHIEYPDISPFLSRAGTYMSPISTNPINAELLYRILQAISFPGEVSGNHPVVLTSFPDEANTNILVELAFHRRALGPIQLPYAVMAEYKVPAWRKF